MIPGENIKGIVHSNHWHASLQLPEEHRQLCWAQLKRDFQKIIDDSAPGDWVGHRGHRIIPELFDAWHAFRAEATPRVELQKRITGSERPRDTTLLERALLEDKNLATLCTHLIESEPAIWTHTNVEIVEPTNNLMERITPRALL